MDIKFDQTYRIVNKVNTFYGRTGKVTTVYNDGTISFKLDSDHPQPTGRHKIFYMDYVIDLKTTDIRPHYGQDGTLPRVLIGSGRTFNMTKYIGEILETGRNVLLITNCHFSLAQVQMQGYEPKGKLKTMTPSVAWGHGWNMECPDRLPTGYSEDDWELVIEPEVFNSCAALYHRFDPPIEDIAQACVEFSNNGIVNWSDIRTGRTT
jgi:hypothetical protein